MASPTTCPPVRGGGGATPRPLAAAHVDGSIVATAGHHFYARVATSPAEISVDIVSVAEEITGAPTKTPNLLMDAFTLPASHRHGLPLSLSTLLIATAIGILAALLVLQAVKR